MSKMMHRLNYKFPTKKISINVHEIYKYIYTIIYSPTHSAWLTAAFVLVEMTGVVEAASILDITSYSKESRCSNDKSQELEPIL